jgi:hypothetical protein
LKISLSCMPSTPSDMLTRSNSSTLPPTASSSSSTGSSSCSDSYPLSFGLYNTHSVWESCIIQRYNTTGIIPQLYIQTHMGPSPKTIKLWTSQKYICCNLLLLS